MKSTSKQRRLAFWPLPTPGSERPLVGKTHTHTLSMARWAVQTLIPKLQVVASLKEPAGRKPAGR